MLEKIFILINYSAKTNLYFINITICKIVKHNKLSNLIFTKKSTYFLNLKSNLC